jgi:hypothetical protein
MSLSMYDVSIPMMIRGFAVLSGYLDAAADRAEEHKIDPFRPYPGAPLSRHVVLGGRDSARQ